jgi:hypothetical protein
VDGFATIAGLIIGSIPSHPIFYLSLFFENCRICISGVHQFWNQRFTVRLLSASVMAAPAALALAKLFYPETEKSQTKAGDIKVPKGSENF